ncbi:MAG: CsgG/HfaB family protein [Treponema sp.]|jgi:hypothetical protein|nr:CsgG/HfaB family protein [Treponema sp.]
MRFPSICNYNLKITALLVLLVTSCATSVKIEVKRPPTLNTAGIKRIAIMPFEATGVNKEMAQYATATVISKIQALNYFTLVASSEIESLRRNNQSIENYVDALFTGQIIRIDTKNEAYNRSYKTKDGKTVNYTDYTTNVEIEFNYSIVLARDGRLIGPVLKNGKNSASDRKNYPSAPPLVRTAIDDQLEYLGRDIAPYTAIETRTFASEKSQDKVLKAEMKNVLDQVKSGNYKTALSAYLDIYGRYKSISAAENASILHELLDNTLTAKTFIQQVLDETGNPRARDILARLNKILQDQAVLDSEYSDNFSRTERAAVFASEEIQKVLPKDARVWIYNNSANNAITSAVADNITSDFIKKKISVVDRQNIKLIEAEQKIQMSGFVSDNDFISIGNAAGANTIVVIDITGTGAARRLQVRVLNVEKGVPIMQSDTSEKWRL